MGGGGGGGGGGVHAWVTWFLSEHTAWKNDDA